MGAPAVTAGATNGLVLSSALYCQFNQIRGFAWGASGALLILGAGSGNNVFRNLDPSGESLLTPISDSGLKTNRFPGGIPGLAYVSLAANSGTPSVGNDTSNGYWATANTGATIITNFADGFTGQRISIMANDGNTTVQHNSGLILKAGTSVNLPAGGFIHFIRDPALWREFSRSF
jgi:hypothetical protein